MNSNKIKKTEEMIRFEKETGKKAVWRGLITNEFKKWKRGEKVYTHEGTRWTIYVDSDTDKKWKKFLTEIKKQKENYSISQLGKDGINLLIDVYEKVRKVGKDINFNLIKELTTNSLDLSLINPKSAIREELIQVITPLHFFIQRKKSLSLTLKK